MARKKQSPFEDIMEITSKFPWWAGVLLAAIAYFLLHAYASKEISSPTDMQNIGEHFAKNLFRMLAGFGQYVLPAAFLFGAIMSAFKQLSRNKSSTLSVNKRANHICPKCGGTMVLRTAKRGGNIGSKFWGCNNYPKCRSTMALAK